MLGSPWKTCRKRSDSATCSNFDPGSVMAMKRLPAFSAPTTCFTRSKKYCLKMFGSKVVPDLLETTNRVLARSTLPSNALICDGSVESRDRKSTRLNSSHGYISYAVSLDRKSTRLNSSHGYISYAVFCLQENARYGFH